MFDNNIHISKSYSEAEKVVLYNGNCLNLLDQIPDKKIQLIVTSPPYNIGKEYEKKLKLENYLLQQERVIRECERVLSDNGSICWQVGNYVDNGYIIPLDTVLYPIFSDLGLLLRNRIIWHFEHGLHCSNRFSGRYETIMWFTRKTKNYVFNLDPIRVPQKYPGKKYFWIIFRLIHWSNLKSACDSFLYSGFRNCYVLIFCFCASSTPVVSDGCNNGCPCS